MPARKTEPFTEIKGSFDSGVAKDAPPALRMTLWGTGGGKAVSGGVLMSRPSGRPNSASRLSYSMAATSDESSA